MTNPSRPTRQDILELLSFLPRFSEAGFEPVADCTSSAVDPSAVMQLPSPSCDGSVEAFVRVASKACWSDYDYDPQVAGRMLASPEAVGSADMGQIKSMLTYYVRGERFWDGHWAALIKNGEIQRLLRRLAEIHALKIR